MKRTRRVAIIAVMILAGIALVAAPALGQKGRSDRSDRGMGRGMGPAFTQEQLDQIAKIKDKYADQQAELTNRLKAMMVEAKDSMGKGEPDFNAIEKRMTEAADIRLKLAKIHLNIQKEIRPLLDDDQKVLFDRGLGRMMCGGMWGHEGRGMRGHSRMMGGRGMMDHSGMMGGCGMQGHPGMMGCCGMQGQAGMMGGCGMQGHPGMGPGAGQGMGMGPGGGQMNAPWCPFAKDDDSKDDD